MLVPWPALAVVWLVAPAFAASAQVPTLTHSAPWIGHPLELELGGAAPGSLVRLYFSPGEARTPTPYGTLELERSRLVLLGSGAAGADGTFHHQELVPADPAKSETWGHYQALVQDSAASAGWTFSQAVHLRYLGTRLYETCVGAGFDGESHPAELRVFSLPKGIVLGGLSLAGAPLPFLEPGPGIAEPVFTADLALGAVLPAADRLVVFDNFALSTLATLPLANASPIAGQGLDGRSAVVLEAGAGRILWVDLATAAVTDSLSLPSPVTAEWTVLPDGREAWIAESDPGQPRPSLRRVDLARRVVLERVLVGPQDGSSLAGLGSAPGLVLASTHFSDLQVVHAALSAVDLASTPVLVQTIEFAQSIATAMQPMDDLVALATHWSMGPGSEILRVAHLDAPLVLRELPAPPSMTLGNDIEYRAFAQDVDGFWALHPCCDWDGGPGSILHFSFASQTWDEMGSFGSEGPYALALARDDFTHAVAVASDGAHCVGCSTPVLHILDVASSRLESIAGGWGPIALKAMTVP